jgi:outer membrane receptor protein involved in Fe transport
MAGHRRLLVQRVGDHQRQHRGLIGNYVQDVAASGQHLVDLSKAAGVARARQRRRRELCRPPLGRQQNSFTVKGFITADATVFYERDWYSLHFNVKNLFDNDYILNRGGNSVFPGEPRTFLMSAHARF